MTLDLSSHVTADMQRLVANAPQASISSTVIRSPGWCASWSSNIQIFTKHIDAGVRRFQAGIIWAQPMIELGCVQAVNSISMAFGTCDGRDLMSDKSSTDKSAPRDLEIQVTELQSAVKALAEQIEKIQVTRTSCVECSCGPCAECSSCRICRICEVCRVCRVCQICSECSCGPCIM